MTELQFQRVSRIALDQAAKQSQVVAPPAPCGRSSALWVIFVSVIVVLACTAFAFPDLVA